MIQVSQRLRSISPSATLAIDAKAKKLKAEGADVLNFVAGEPDFDPPPAVIEAALKAVREPSTHKYTPAGGTLSLKKAVAAHLERDFGVRYDPSEIVVSCGAKHSLYNAFLALVNPGDEVLLPSPYWVTYPEQVRLAGGVPVLVECSESEGYRLTARALRAKLTPRTRGLVLNSPSNPTGAVVPRAELEAIGDLVLEKNLWVVSDEIYAKLSYGEVPACFPSLSPELRERTVLVNGVSKAYAMTGWRIGYAAAPKPLADAMGDFQSHSTSNPSVVAQKAAEAALALPDSEIRPMVETFRRRRDLLVAGLRKIPGTRCPEPQGAFYVFPNVQGWLAGGRENTLKLADFLLERLQVAVTPGSAFGAEGYLRLSYAVSEQVLEEGLRRLREAFGGA